MFPCKQLLEFDLEMVLNFSENANILEYEIKFEKNSRACDWLSETWDRLGLIFEREDFDLSLFEFSFHN